ncbi:MAG: serine/threonine-protein kinase, partial [Thermoanaerobaculia bacterium]
MSIEHKRRILELLEEALEVPSGERTAFLDAHCKGEATRREVEALLATEPHSEVLGAPAFSVHAEDAAIGRRVGSYEIVRLIDRGGMGSVYLAEREDFDQQVALKLLRRGLDLDESLVRRFHNERQILAHLDHPNIAKLLDGGTTEDRLPYFVMELVDGAPIDRYCEQHELSIEKRLRLFRKVCAAVQFAHQNLVIHRDLKPSNVLIAADGEPKLLDFGIAKLLEGGVAALTLDTAPGHGAMTPRYASPEQIRLEPVTTASDVYSLGVLLYELLTGRTPYRLASDRSDEVARAVCEQEPEKPSTAVRRQASESSTETLRDPRKLRQLLAGDLDSIVLKALRKRPEMRYGSVDQFSEDIHRYLSGLPVDAREGTGLYRFGKFVRRNKVPLTVISAFLALMIGFGFVWLQLLTQRQRADATSEFLVGIFQGADPNKANARELDALGLLRRAKAQIPVFFRDDFRSQMKFAGTLGKL